MATLGMPVAMAPPRAAAGGDNGHVHAHDHDHDHDEDDPCSEESMAFDPTMASCCERDQRDFDKAMKLKAVLTAHDPTSKGVRVRQQLFQPPAPSEDPSQHLRAVIPPLVQPSDRLSDSDSDFDDSDDEFGLDAGMAALLASRRKQLEQAARDAADGYGIVLEADLATLLRELQREPEVPRVALVTDGSVRSTDFLRDMHGEMAATAQRYIGSKFNLVRAASSSAVRDEDAARQLRLGALPCVAAFRRGEKVDTVTLDAKMLVTEPSVLWEARLLPWLHRCDVLTEERQAPRATRSAATRPADASEDDKEREGFDCGMEGCRLRFSYEHEHVGASEEAKAEASAWRQPSASRRS